MGRQAKIDLKDYSGSSHFVRSVLFILLTGKTEGLQYLPVDDQAKKAIRFGTEWITRLEKWVQ
jgi:hypothetical protein